MLTVSEKSGQGATNPPKSLEKEIADFRKSAQDSWKSLALGIRKDRVGIPFQRLLAFSVSSVNVTDSIYGFCKLEAAPSLCSQENY